MPAAPTTGPTAGFAQYRKAIIAGLTMLATILGELVNAALVHGVAARWLGFGAAAVGGLLATLGVVRVSNAPMPGAVPDAAPLMITAAPDLAAVLKQVLEAVQGLHGSLPASVVKQLLPLLAGPGTNQPPVQPAPQPLPDGQPGLIGVPSAPAAPPDASQPFPVADSGGSPVGMMP